MKARATGEGGDLTRRHEVEARFHDHKAEASHLQFPYSSGIMKYAVEHSLQRLGDLSGKILVEFGCGQGGSTVQLAQAGATVWAFDLSTGMAAVTRERAQAEGVGSRVYVALMAGEQLAYKDASADVVYGVSVVHHLGLEAARREVHRVLRPGGRAVFVEPLSHNIVINLFRRLTPGRRTPTEQPLRYRDLLYLAEPFSSLSHREFFLLSLLALPVERVFGARAFRIVFEPLLRVEQVLFSWMPFLRKYAWMSVFTLVK